MKNVKNNTRSREGKDMVKSHKCNLKEITNTTKFSYSAVHVRAIYIFIWRQSHRVVTLQLDFLTHVHLRQSIEYKLTRSTMTLSWCDLILCTTLLCRLISKRRQRRRNVNIFTLKATLTPHNSKSRMVTHTFLYIIRFEI